VFDVLHDIDQSDSIYKVSRIKHTYMKPRIEAIIPAHNEKKSIRDYVAGLAD